MEDIVERIKYLKDVKNLSFYQIESQLSISRKVVSKIYNGNNERIKKVPKLEKYRSLISEWFKEYPSLKAWQVFDWLRNRQIDVSYPTVVVFTKEYRKKRDKVYHNLTFLPGEEGQVDWAIINKPSIGKVYCFTLVMSYSRYLFAYLFPRSSFEFFIEGHILAFKAMNGLPHSLRYDNLKSVVIKRKPEVSYNSSFLEFCRHYNINIRLCNPGAGNEKGRVERAIRTLKENYFNDTFQCSKITSANAGLLKWVNHKNQKLHRTTNKLPIDQFKEEKLQSLPFIDWNNVNIHPPVLSTKTAMVHFDRNTYSIPDYLPGKPISIHASPTFVRMYYKNKKVANHPRSFKINETINNPIT